MTLAGICCRATPGCRLKAKPQFVSVNQNLAPGEEKTLSMERTGRWADPASPAGPGEVGSTASICSPAPASQRWLEAGGCPKRLAWGLSLSRNPAKLISFLSLDLQQAVSDGAAGVIPPLVPGWEEGYSPPLRE